MSTEPLFSAEPPPPSGMRSGTKILLGLGIGCGFLALLACGGLIATVYWATSFLKNSTSEDPAVIRRLTADIVDIEIPKGLEPKLSIDMKVPFSKNNDPLITGVVYAGEQGHSTLILMEFRGGIADDETREEVQEKVRQALAQNGRKHADIDMTNGKSSTRELTIHGEPATFNVGIGTNRTTKEEVWSIKGDFAGKQGPAQFTFVGPTSVYGEDDVNKMLESMK